MVLSRRIFTTRQLCEARDPGGHGAINILCRLSAMIYEKLIAPGSARNSFE